MDIVETTDTNGRPAQPILDLWGALRDCEGIMPPLGPDHAKAIRAALASETEECAKVAETYAGHGARADVCMGIATAIRARSLIERSKTNG
jgi:hypothetical protein